MKTLTFADYLAVLEQSVSKQGEDFNKRIIEINELRTHTAQLATMQKHLKHYKALKYLVESYGLNIG